MLNHIKNIRFISLIILLFFIIFFTSCKDNKPNNLKKADNIIRSATNNEKLTNDSGISQKVDKNVEIDSYLKKARELNSSDINESIRYYFKAHNLGYDLLDDNVFNNELMKYAKTVLYKNNKSMDDKQLDDQIAIGDLNDDSKPEIAIFNDRYTLDDLTSNKNSIDIYCYNKDNYTLISSYKGKYIPEHCIKIVIGKIAKNKTGIVMEGLNGAHGGQAYVYILNNNNLTFAIDDIDFEKLYGVYPTEIKDIDNDGILEFSGMEIDPNSSDQSMVYSDKIIRWYKWNGTNGIIECKVEKRIDRPTGQNNNNNIPIDYN
ncbi:hypothetical protein [Thermoanaerobacterium thermosaccharolyticum]|uniref:hypothetical protein n=1 Tax=Thermoanaerobacterium thermosaccharolyticum TaxID=1517 RepID=UPI0020A3E25B|nr:hypothetical protein [Thermoanaerobacterium thermosaccharolyticum]MCP2239503.1 hypothetical protein [Thermoanaerobacterium thermosaccharolyticum]